MIGLGLLSETLLDDVTVERVAVRGEQTGLQEWRRVINLVFFGLARWKQKSSIPIRVRRENVTTYPLVEF